MKLYDLAQYYDIAFSWDPSHEVRILRRLFNTHVDGSVTSLLEPACGSGRMLRALASRGFEVVGYDNSPNMVSYAKAQSRGQEGDRTTVLEGDMRSFRIDRTFDAVLCPINSFRYLLDDNAIESHLNNTYSMLKLGGVYVVHFDFAFDGPLPSEDSDWELSRDGVTVHTRWRAVKQDHASKRSHELAELTVTEGEKSVEIRDEHVQRLWTEEEWRGFIASRTQFEIVGRYDDQGREVAPEKRLSGEDGNVYQVLKRVE